MIRDKIQTEAVNAWINAGHRGILNMTMRSGKTIAAFRAIHKSFAGHHILFSAETVSREITLYEEILKFKEIFPELYSELFVESKELTSILVKHSKLKKPTPVHHYVNKYIKGVWFENVTFSCYTGNNKVLETYAQYPNKLVVVIDEIHDAATGVYSAIFKHTLELGIPTLGLTGTTRSSTKVNKEAISDNATYNAIGATKEMIYKEYKLPIVYRYTLEQAVEDGLWPQYDIIVVNHNLSTTPTIKGTKKKKPHTYSEHEYYSYNMGMYEWAKRTPKMAKMSNAFRTRALGILYKAQSKLDVVHKITELETNQSVVINKYINNVPFKIPILTGKNKKKDNDALLADFLSGKHKAIASSNLIAQGTSIKTNDGVSIIMMSYDSKSEPFNQRAARGLLKDGSKIPRIWILKTTGTYEDRWFSTATYNLIGSARRVYNVTSGAILSSGSVEEVKRSAY